MNGFQEEEEEEEEEQQQQHHIDCMDLAFQKLQVYYDIFENPLVMIHMELKNYLQLEPDMKLLTVQIVA